MLIAVQDRSRALVSTVFALAAALALTLPLLWLASGKQLALPTAGSSLKQVGASTLTQFEPNVGQTDPSVLYMAHSGSGLLYFGPDQVTLAQAGSKAASALQVRFVGAGHATVAAEGPSTSVVNYMVGNDPAKWHTNIPTYAGLSYSGLYNGVTLRYALRYEGKQGVLKGTYVLAPGADPSAVRWQYSGPTAGAPKLDSAGNLHTAVDGKDVIESAPVAWQEINGSRLAVPSSYSLNGGVVGFTVGAYNSSLPLTIDPALQFSSYIGGASSDSANAVAADASGNVYITGLSNSTDFPTSSPYQGSNAGANDVFVSKFNPNGTLAFSTYLGGGGDDYGYGIALDSTGAIYVTGRTQSANFPTHNAYQAASGGNLDVFLSKLSNDGQTLLYSTYLGGSGADVGWGVAADSAGNAYLTGQIVSTNFPTRNAFQAAYGGGANDAFVARINTAASGDASLIYSTYLGGSNADYAGGSGVTNIGHGIATDGAGHAYVAGATNSDNFPTLNAYQATRVSDFDAFAARLDTNASGTASLTYSTLLGGNNYDIAHDIAVDSTGNAYIAGSEGFSNFPVRGSYGACGAGPFVAKLNMAVSGDASLVYSTCFGTTAHGTLTGISVLGSSAVVGGYSSSTGWPLVNQIMPWTAGNDVIAARLSDSGSSLIYSTYLGGAGNDYGYGVASAHVGSDNHTYLAGSTDSANYPVANPYQATNHGMTDGFVSNIDEPAPAPSPTATPAVCQPSFSDVQQSDYFYQAVQYLYCHGVIGGYPDGTFRPGNNTTRGQMLKIVSLGFNLPSYT
ncbi:MAG: SBBP repeat-containing protein, partial [Chloroflexota bacterium]|nr:SBBP repeat-containing protein [Chloroflexota bacterium]